MKEAFSFIAFAAVLVLSVQTPAVAHHGQAAYDNSTLVTVTGTVTVFQFQNPHCIITFDVKDKGEGETQTWQGELTSPNRLLRAGWNVKSVKPGDQVTLTGWRAKSGANSLWITKTIVNGQELKTDMGT
jgi:hypothetical protein